MGALYFRVLKVNPYIVLIGYDVFTQHVIDHTLEHT